MSVAFNIDARHPTPLYHQLERSIRFAIATGKLRAGDQLPTVRQMAVELRINANTVAKVYAELERAGVVETRRGVGTFVRTRDVERQSARGAARHGGGRGARLPRLAERFLADAHALGFSPEEGAERLAGVVNEGV